MRHNLHKYHNTIQFKYVNDIFDNISRDIEVASKNNHLESFNELLDFFINNLKARAFNNSIDAFSKSVTSLVYIFPNLTPDYKKIFIKRVFDSIITSISISIDSNYKGIDKKYIELSYLPLINILKLILQDDDHALFNFSLNRFEEAFYRIDIKEDSENLSFYFNTTLLAWVYFLKSTKSITYEEYNFSYLENNLESLSYDYNFNFVNKYFELFDNIEKQGLWSISRWEVTDPPINEAYIALPFRRWLSYSLTIILLKFEHLIRLNDDLNKIDLNDKFRFIYDDIKKVLDNITSEDDDYKDFIFNNLSGSDLSKELDFKKEKILNVFLFLQKKVEIEHYRKIKEIPLSKGKIDKFRTSVGKLWEDSTLILKILKNLEKIEFLPNEEDINGYGFYRKFLKMKFAFIDGELYQEVFNLSSLGSQLARSIDDIFFNELKNDKIVSTEKINDTIVEFINETENKENIIIFANYKSVDKLKNITYEQNDKKALSNKKFNGIPIIQQFSKYKDSILVIDFSMVKAVIYTNDNPNWYKSQLIVEVTESHRSNITEDIIKEWSEKDGFEYDEDEVDILESNNVNIKILLKYRFIIPEETRYIII